MTKKRIATKSSTFFKPLIIEFIWLKIQTKATVGISRGMGDFGICSAWEGTKWLTWRKEGFSWETAELGETIQIMQLCIILHILHIFKMNFIQDSSYLSIILHILHILKMTFIQDSSQRFSQHFKRTF